MASEQTAQAARAEAGAVAGTVKDETRNVAQQAQDEAANALHRVQRDARERANQEASKFAQTLHDTSRQLQSMSGAADNEGIAATLAREGANASERLASRIDSGGLDALMADVRSWARRQPGTFLLGAAAAGFVAGRLIRNLGGDDAPARTGNGYRSMTTTPELRDRLDPDFGIGGAG